ncbi:MAG TPA: DUF5996 family protein [Anaeromyxobacteraceae bacterium]|nr:DUF5996 family protein [Anaeromyxobacteraceae bacterium]
MSHLSAAWPELPLAPWRATRDTLHMWTQIVGKSLLACPPQNHWWHCALRVSARGLVTPAPIASGDGAFEVELDLVDHVLAVRGDRRTVTAPLVPRTVRAFHEEYLALVRAVGADVHLWTTPVEVHAPIAFDRDEVHRDYDAAAAHRFWQVLRRCDAVFKGLADGFVGKQSPVHFWWGSFDLAATRFSGRRAPERVGADAITREAYSHEVISFGFWPGGALPDGRTVEEPILFAYAAPTPEGFAAARVRPAAARWDERLGEFVLPYEAVRTADDPAGAVRAFCESVYEAGATLGRWDREALERR